jgi:hypothetical protein
MSRNKKEFEIQLAPTALYEGSTLEGFARVIETTRAAAAEAAAAKEVTV